MYKKHVNFYLITFGESAETGLTCLQGLSSPAQWERDAPEGIPAPTFDKFFAVDFVCF